MLSRLIKIVGSIGLLSLISAAPALAQYPSPTYNNVTVLGTCTGCSNGGSTGPFFNGTGTNPFRVSGTTIVDSSRNATFTSLNGYIPQFSARQDGATATAITAPGIGYAAGDTITLNDGCSPHIKIGVNNVSGGLITGFNIAYPGVCSSTPTNPVAQLSSSGAGTGATFTLLYGPIAGSVPVQPLSTGGGNFIMNAPGSAEYTGNTYGGSESVFLGDRAGGVVGIGNFNVAIGHNALGIGGGVQGIYADSITVIGTDALRNLQGGASASVFGYSALKNFTQAGTSANHYLFGVTALGTSAMVNFNGAVSFPWDTAVGHGACNGANAGTISFTNGTCVGSNTGKNLTTASNFLILAGGGNGVDTLSSGSGVIDILSGAQASTLSGSATNTVNIENVIRVTGTNVPSTSVMTVPGRLLLGSAAPVVASGFGTSPTIAGSNGYAAFSITIGTGGTASTGTLTMPFTAANGWACSATDITTQSTTVFATRQIATGSSTTAVALTNFSSVMAAAAWAASDVLVVNCQPY